MSAHHKIKYNDGERVIEGKKNICRQSLYVKKKIVCIETLDDRNAR